jgi:hypothetical protein
MVFEHRPCAHNSPDEDEAREAARPFKHVLHRQHATPRVTEEVDEI